MKKEYKKPSVFVIELTNEDVIVTSGVDGKEKWTDDYTDNEFWPGA